MLQLGYVSCVLSMFWSWYHGTRVHPWFPRRVGFLNATKHSTHAEAHVVARTAMHERLWISGRLIELYASNSKSSSTCALPPEIQRYMPRLWHGIYLQARRIGSLKQRKYGDTNSQSAEWSDHTYAKWISMHSSTSKQLSESPMLATIVTIATCRSNPR
jgi:hypothetical protein